MKRLLIATAFVFMLAAAVFAQSGPRPFILAVNAAGATACGTSPHCAVLTWTAPADAVASSTYNVYQLTGTCPGTAPTSTPSGFTKVNSTGISGLTYTQDLTAAGTYCYFVTQVQGGAESVPSNDAPAVILPFAPNLQAPVAN